MSRVTRLALLVCGALIWLIGSLISAPAAVAHAELLSSDPATARGCPLRPLT